jgi:hypothetical protein
MDCPNNRGRRVSRRDFIKTTAAGAALSYAGLNLGKLITGGKALAQASDSALRVVQINNAAFSKTASNIPHGYAAQDANINTAIVYSGMDQAVMCLTQKASPLEAWRAIVPTPGGANPQYAQAKIGIKVNYFNPGLGTHVAVVDYLINSLVNLLGFTPGNIYVYDGSSGSKQDYLKTALVNGAAVNVGDFGRAGSYPIAGYNSTLTTLINNDTLHYLISAAVCKGHSGYAGGFSLTMKNHYGSFQPLSHSYDGYLAGINAHSKIQNKTILALIDAIYCCNGATGTTRTTPVNKLIVGKVPIAVDFVSAKNLIELPVNQGGCGYTVDWANRVNKWPDEGVFMLNGSRLDLATLSSLPMITACATDTVKPKAPTNLQITKG